MKLGLLRLKIKNALKAPCVTKALAWILSKYLSFVYYTARWTYRDIENIKPYWEKNIPLLGAFWHNRLGVMTYAWKSKAPLYMMISAHNDGKIISEVIASKGIQTIAGSTSKGASKALKDSVRALKQGISVGITPDGPRGPRYHAQQGVVQIARLANVDILPISYAVTNRIMLKSWDRLIIPLPFSKGVFIYGKPIPAETFRTKEDAEKTLKLLENRLIDLSQEADRLCGHTPIERAP